MIASWCALRARRCDHRGARASSVGSVFATPVRTLPPLAVFLAFAVPSILTSVVLAWTCRKIVQRATTWRRQLVLAIGFTLAGGFLTGVVFAVEGATDAIGHGHQELLPVLTVYPLYGVLGAIRSLPLAGAVAFAGVLALRWAGMRGPTRPQTDHHTSRLRSYS